MKRITADLDTKNKVYLSFSIYKSLKYIEKITYIEIKPSSSKGYHLIVWTNKNYSLKQQYKLRAIIGDDKQRIKLDLKRKVGRNTLFYKKEIIKPKINKSIKTPLTSI